MFLSLISFFEVFRRRAVAFFGWIANVLIGLVSLSFPNFQDFLRKIIPNHSSRISREDFRSAGQQNRFSGLDVTKISVVKANYSGNIFDYRIID
jgi:hypothetical protein